MLSIRAVFIRIRHLLNLQQKTALIFIAEDGRPTVMSPIGHMLTTISRPIRSTSTLSSECIRAREILEADIGSRIRSLIINAARNRPSAQLVDVVLQISKFSYRTDPSTKFVSPLVEHFVCPIKKAQVFRQLGHFYTGKINTWKLRTH
jgi:hypothetical protein